MANSTFSGAVRSENGFKTIVKNSSTGALSSDMTLSTYVATVTVADGDTTGKESAIGIPSNFIPMGVTVAVTTAAANAVNLVDIGTDADTDGFVDGITAAVNSTGFKGFFPCNGVLGMSGGTTTAATETADEVEVVLSGDPGGDTVVVLKFFGLSMDLSTWLSAARLKIHIGLYLKIIFLIFLFSISHLINLYFVEFLNSLVL